MDSGRGVGDWTRWQAAGPLRFGLETARERSEIWAIRDGLVDVPAKNRTMVDDRGARHLKRVSLNSSNAVAPQRRQQA